MVMKISGEYLTKIIENRKKNSYKKIAPVQEIVKLFFQLKELDNQPKEFYTGRYAYPKLAREAKLLLMACGGEIDDALWALDNMKYKSHKGNDYDWSIITCIKKKKEKIIEKNKC